MKKYFLILLTIPLLVKAHEDQIFTSVYDNITVRIETVHFMEEVNKTKYIGEYASRLCDSLDFNYPILLDFIHDYARFHNPSHYLSYDSGDYYIIWDGDTSKIKAPSKDNFLVIRQIEYSFDISKTLKLLCLAINNFYEIKEKTAIHRYPGWSEQMNYLFPSINDQEKLSIGENSGLIQQILSQQIFRPEKFDMNDLYISYFTQNNQYYIYQRIRQKVEILDSISSVFAFERSTVLDAFCFLDTKNFKYYLTQGSRYNVSSLHNIETINIDDFYDGMIIKWLGDDIYVIDYCTLSCGKQRFLYLAKQDILVEDFTKIIDSYRKK